MGQNTDVLMQTCSKLADALEPLAKKIAGESEVLEKRVRTMGNTVLTWVKEARRKSEVASWQKELDEVKSKRNVLARKIESLKDSPLSEATKAAKDLESKIKKKDFLNFFKTQQSLDEAKKVLKQSQQAIDKTEVRLTAIHASYARIDDNCDTVTDYLKKALKEALENDSLKTPGRNPLVQEWTDKFERFLTKSNPNGLAQLEDFQAVADKKAEVFKKLSSQIGKTKTWTENTRKPMMKQIEDEISSLSKVISLLATVVGKAQWAWWEETINLPRTILSLPAIRKLIKETETADARVSTFGESLFSKLYKLNSAFENLGKDFAGAGNDNSPESIKIVLKSIEKSQGAIEESPTAIRQSYIEKFEKYLRFVLDLAKKSGPVDDNEWKWLQKINLECSIPARMQTKDAIANLEKSFLEAEGTAHRFKKNTEIQKAYKNYKTVHKTFKKTAETFFKLQEEIYKRSSKLLDTLSSK